MGPGSGPTPSRGWSSRPHAAGRGAAGSFALSGDAERRQHEHGVTVAPRLRQEEWPERRSRGPSSGRAAAVSTASDESDGAPCHGIRSSTVTTVGERAACGRVRCVRMATLLLVHHTASPAMHSMFDAVRPAPPTRRSKASTSSSGPRCGDRGRRARRRRLPARDAREPRVHVGRAEALLRPDLLPVPRGDRRPPYGLYVHGNNDTTGAIRAVEMVTTGLQWRLAQAQVSVIGEPAKADLDACWELARPSPPGSPG